MVTGSALALCPRLKFPKPLSRAPFWGPSTIIGFNYDSTKGILTPFQTNSTLPSSGYSGNTTAEIVVHPSGKFLYGSNRGYNTIAVYQINGTNGTFTLVQQAPTGATPRQFAVEPTGAFCIVADQDSGDIRLYSINQATGMLTYKSQIITSVSTPVCIVPFVWEPPQPVVSAAFTPSNIVSLSLSNASSLFTYQLYASPSLSDPSGWHLVDTGARGQTQFLRTNLLSQEFFRIGVLTNY